VAALVGPQQATVGGHDLDLDQVVAGEPVASREHAEPAARGETGDSDRGTGAGRDRLPVLPEGAVGGEGGRARPEPGALTVAADLDVGQTAQVQDQAVPGRVAGEAVRAASRHQTPTALAGEVDDLAHVRGARGLDHRLGTRAVVAAVPDQSRCPVPRGLGQDDPAVERRRELPELRRLVVDGPRPGPRRPEQAPCRDGARHRGAPLDELAAIDPSRHRPV
jgi:hypothetical protein